MKIKLINTELFIKANGLKEVTNPIILDRGSIPTPDGLLSTEIFGTTPKERRTTFAYIDLHSYFLHPLVYKTLKRLDRRIDSVIGGTKKYIINSSGDLIEDPNGFTGIDWLYANWEKLKFKRNESKGRGERIDLLEKNSKNELFLRYFIVEPAFYRDINLQNVSQGKPSLHEINVGSDQIPNGSSYSKLLRLVSSIKMSGNFVFTLNNTKYQIQQCITDIYNYFKSRIEKKFGIIKKGIMGKTVDYGSRLVISSPHHDTNKFEDNIIDSTHAGLPLGNCLSNATPFAIGWLSNFFKREFEANQNKYPAYNMKTGKIEYIEVKNPAAYYNDDYCNKLLTKYLKSYPQRFDPIEIPTTETKTKYVMLFEGFNETTGTEERRYMTITDLMFICATEIYEDKHIIVSRYPITTFQSLFTIKARPLTTQETCTMTVKGQTYRFYPVIDLSLEYKDIPNKFIEVMMMSNIYLKTLGADYDGDQVSIRTVFTQEANLECEKLMRDPKNFFSSNGNNVRETSNEAIQTLFALTK